MGGGEQTKDESGTLHVLWVIIWDPFSSISTEELQQSTHIMFPPCFQQPQRGKNPGWHRKGRSCGNPCTHCCSCLQSAFPTLFLGIGKCGWTVAVSLGKSQKPWSLCKVLCWSEPVQNTPVFRCELLPQHLALTTPEIWKSPEISCPHPAAAPPSELRFGLIQPVPAAGGTGRGWGSPCSAR